MTFLQSIMIVQMRQIANKINTYFTKKDGWLYLVLLIIISHVTAGLEGELNAQTYLLNLAILLAFFSPLLILDAFKYRLEQNWKSPYFNPIYFSIQIVYLSAANIINVGLPASGSLVAFNEEILALSSIYMVLLAITIHLSRYFSNGFSWFNRLKHISLDKALILVLFIIAGLLSVLITSHKDQLIQNQTLEIEVRYGEIIENFPFFIVVWLQLFLTYMAGFFFYYVNAHFLIPKLLKQRGILYYIAGALGTIFIFYPILGGIINNLPLNQLAPILLPSENYDVFDPVNRAVVLGIMALSLPITLVVEWFKQNNDIVNLQKQQIEKELNLLKQQINPHFFFNTLNNLYALSLSQSKQTPEVILQLSELMRYVIYKGKEANVALEEEIKYIEDYINLQRIRLHQKLDLTVNKDIAENKLKISPLLLIILVENAFKHGIEPAEGSVKLKIDIIADKNSLEFKCVNTFEGENNDTGIGLENLKRRLEILYPERHELSLIKQQPYFTAALKITFE